MTTLLASCRRGAALAALVLFSGSAAIAQVATRKGLTIDGAKTIATAAANEARRLAPRHIHNMAWGDEDRKTLYLCARDRLYRIRLNIAGAGLSAPATSVAPSSARR